MSPHAVPGHARVRVGPLGTGTLTAAWPQDLGQDGGRCGGGRTVTGTLLAADGRAPARLLETADVIVAAGGAEGTGPGDWLRRYPGCAVAATRTAPGECSVATRDGVLRSLTARGPSDADALACAVFVHGWLAAGWSLDLLHPAVLHVSHGAGERPEPGAPLFFSFGYCPASGDGAEASGPPAEPDSASRTCRASGAPSAS